MKKTAIAWTTFSANPLKYRRKTDGAVVWSCVKTSPGCAHCYSEALALRYNRGRVFNSKNMEELEPFLDEKELRLMLTKQTCDGLPVSGSRCFVGDMTDVFGEWVPDELIDRLFAVFALRPDVTWQVLTKRAERMRAYLSTRDRHNSLELAADALFPGKGHPSFGGRHLLPRLPLDNVWLGCSVENQQYADERIPHLLQTPAAARFLSCEPLLGPVHLLPMWLQTKLPCPDGIPGCEVLHMGLPSPINWVIIGGESGHGYRPMETQWARDLVAQCRRAGVAPFFKQSAAPRTEMGIELDGEIIREYPAARLPLSLFQKDD